MVISPGSVGKSRLDPGATFVVSSGPTRASTTVGSSRSQMIRLIAARRKTIAEGESVAREEDKQLQTVSLQCQINTLGLGQTSQYADSIRFG